MIKPYTLFLSFSSVQLLNHVPLFVAPWSAACQAFLSITNSWSLFKLHRVCYTTISSLVVPFSSCLQSFPASGSFPVKSSPVLHIRWPKYWSFSFSISPSNEHPGLIFFRMDWLDLLAVHGTLKSLFQFKSINSFFSPLKFYFFELKKIFLSFTKLY